MTLERTLAIIKPDAVSDNHIGNILGVIEENDLQIIAGKMMRLSTEQVEALYAEHKEKPFYQPLQGFMLSGAVMVLILEGKNATQRLRSIMGATLPANAEPGTIRYLYARKNKGDAAQENAIHGSDSQESAAREIDLFFTKKEIYPR